MSGWEQSEFSTPSNHVKAAAAALATGGLMLLAQAVMVFGNLSGGSKSVDQDLFHVPVIRRFIEGWPTPDISDYEATVTPGFHLLMAGVVSLVSESLIDQNLVLLRMAQGGFALLFFVIVTYRLCLVAPVTWAIAAVLPLLFDRYMAGSLGWVSPEGAGWLTMLLVLVCVIDFRDWRWMVGVGSVLLIAVVATRQTNAWLAGMIWLAGWLGHRPKQDLPPGVEWTPGRLVPRPKELDLRNQLPRASVAFAATLPAIGLLAYFVWVWGGLVPPGFQTGNTDTVVHIDVASEHTGGNLAFPAVALSLTGLVGLFYLPLLFGTVSHIFQDKIHGRKLLVAGLVVGLLAAIIPETSYSKEDGRWGSLWEIARVLPTFYDRAPGIAIFSSIGGGIIAMTLLAVPSRERIVLAASWAGFVLANSFNSQAWVRYIEPFALFWHLMLIRAAWKYNPLEDPYRRSMIRLVPPVVLGLGLGGLTLLRLLGSTDPGKLPFVPPPGEQEAAEVVEEELGVSNDDSPTDGQETVD